MASKKAQWAFPGLHYFRDDRVDRQLFFGRDAEIQELGERILAEDITVLFGKSGDGKTSLINAGLKQAFRERGFMPVRARIFNSPEGLSPIATLFDELRTEAGANGVQLPAGWQKATLWETFRGLRPTDYNQLKPIVLILDQFEELFTLMAERMDEQEQFIQQLADLVRGRVPAEVRHRTHSKLKEVRKGSPEALELEKLLYGSSSSLVTILISLREDYLAFLDNLGKRIPKVYHSRYRLPSLSVAQARHAILNPPREDVLSEQKFSITEDAGKAITKFLTVQSPASGVSEEAVGPPQLQVLCRQLEEQMRRQGKDTIELADLGGVAGMRRLLSRFYRNITRKFKVLKLGSGPRRLKGIFGLLRRFQPVHSPRLAVRLLCEDRLITAAGNRNSRHEDEIIREVGVSVSDLQTLVESRLLRREPRLQEAFYELSHDSLVRSLQTAGAFRKTWGNSLKISLIAMLVFASLQWGWPYLNSWFELNKLESELLALKKGHVPVDVFKVQLSVARRTVSDTFKLSRIQKDYDLWRQDTLADSIASFNSPYLASADSLLGILRSEFGDSELVTALQADIRVKRVAEIEARYQQWVANLASEDTRDAAFEALEAYLDSTYLDLDKPTRITELKRDLAIRRGQKAAARQLAAEAERQRELVSKQLFAAIQLKEPESAVVKTETGEMERLQIVVADEPSFRSVFLNGGKIARTLTRQRNVGDWRGELPISRNDAAVVAIIRVLDNHENEAEKRFRFEIDREPPNVSSVSVQYKDTEMNVWRTMPDDFWRSETAWRIVVKTTELLTKASAKIEYSTQLAGKDIMVLPVAQNIPATSLGSKTVMFAGQAMSVTADNLRCKLTLTDRAGWVRDVDIGAWKLPREERKYLSEVQVKSLILENDFFCSDRGHSWDNPGGRGIDNQFREPKNGKVVYDLATGLTWQKSGSNEPMTLELASAYVALQLNFKKYGGYSDWRLPTLAEAMSLVEAKEMNAGLYLDPVFDQVQTWIWTSDNASGSAAWVVYFGDGGCSYKLIDYTSFVRAVR